MGRSFRFQNQNRTCLLCISRHFSVNHIHKHSCIKLKSIKLMDPFFFSELRITRGPENAVVLIGDRHTFHCSTKVTNSNSTDTDIQTTVSWQKDDQIITNRGSKNFRILRRSGKLRFAHVGKSDEGYYRCIAEFQSEFDRPIKVHSSYAKLTVQGMLHCSTTQFHVTCSKNFL